ncbi:50S ribosomal protein L2 [Candidatus Peregrinibacteria bacterium]|nr:50S ribosomal protein L2 [Candidatus Peregrinibacteria bacterium]
MPVKNYKATTAGRRHMTSLTYEEVTTNKPAKRLAPGKKTGSGRNNRGVITIRHKGGGHKRKYRNIDFKQVDKKGIPAKVATIEYDPNRTALIMLVNYADGEKRYHLAPEGIQVGDEIITKEKAKIISGNRIKLKYVPAGHSVYNLELEQGKGGQIVRSAGTSASVMAVEKEFAQIKLPSGESRYISKECYATLGRVSNVDHTLVKIGKAGRNRWLGKRPQVRGKVMNPVDHPHGGGEGAQPIGLIYPKTPWGLPALGVKTRKRKYSDKMIVRRRKGDKLNK